MAAMARETARETLYVAGLDTSLAKAQLREALFLRFSRYGQVVDVVCMKRQRRLRGQAWVVFRSTSDAARALAGAQGKMMLGRRMRLDFAKVKSNATAVRDGTWLPAGARREGCGADGKPPRSVADLVPLMPRAQTAFWLVQDLPTEANEAAIAALFGQYKGFLGVKQKKENGGGAAGQEQEEDVDMNAAAESNAFTIEFSSPANAATAQRGLSGFKLTPTDVLDIEFV
jgi:U2 small nuclear ribonucleoprotein B''